MLTRVVNFYLRAFTFYAAGPEKLFESIRRWCRSEHWSYKFVGLGQMVSMAFTIIMLISNVIQPTLNSVLFMFFYIIIYYSYLFFLIEQYQQT